ncbi:MAG: Lpg1974 family pore-forming outer membrane protein, partial [Chlamydiales bacterium]
MKNLFFLIIIFNLTLSSLLAQSYTCVDSEICQNGLLLGAEWLYWKAEQSQMEIAADVEGRNGGTLIASRVVIPDFNYSSGYKVYADYILNDCWAIGTVFTHLPSQPYVSASHNPASIDTNFIAFNVDLYPLFTLFEQQHFSSIDIQWKLNLYYADLYIRRTLCFCNCFTINPYIGGRGFWMKQNIHTNASSPNAAPGATSF